VPIKDGDLPYLFLTRFSQRTRLGFDSAFLHRASAPDSRARLRRSSLASSS
jgi:hypothetical protein